MLSVWTELPKGEIHLRLWFFGQRNRMSIRDDSNDLGRLADPWGQSEFAADGIAIRKVPRGHRLVNNGHKRRVGHGVGPIPGVIGTKSSPQHQPKTQRIKIVLRHGSRGDRYFVFEVFPG